MFLASLSIVRSLYLAGLTFGPLFCPVSLYVWCPDTTVLYLSIVQLGILHCKTFSVVPLLRIVLASGIFCACTSILGFFFSISVRNKIGILMEIALSLQVALVIAVPTILALPVYEHGDPSCF